jgi:hypothetical protein
MAGVALNMNRAGWNTGKNPELTGKALNLWFVRHEPGRSEYEHLKQMYDQEVRGNKVKTKKPF